MSLRILQFGATGQLAREMLDRAGPGVTITALSRAEVDLTDAGAVARAVAEAGDIDLVLNAAAYTAVDKAESEPDLAYAVNAWAPAAMARACQARGLPLLHVSTDMVFSGDKAAPYVETDAPAPLHVYGASKLAGEQAVLGACDRALVMRVSWLFSAYGQNFLQMMLRLGETQPVLKVVADQRARPTASGDLAAFILSQGERLAKAPAGAPEWGLLHVVNEGAASRYDMAQAIFALTRPGDPPAMEPVPTTAFPTPARRALNGELDSGRMQAVFSLQLRPWQEALEDVVAQLSAQKETA
ncbi:MAG: dTDP-4-dehydrorhamnose reductase [Phenylobacterium sp.]|uniref:dTDP-4-dehydrorhamnose reductase n=1 Tax=Phenylobacterium sp. TaxID=1871053 RepID=UPI0027191AC9|nr:dTDP-4-dehydrorhamnose reductase [Phenylobacterium sp.]MDO8411933.1 dTDP-4-dehydrorhamnose reductase [Phenylobacterium sp.]